MIKNNLHLEKEVFFNDEPNDWNDELLESSHSTAFQTSNWAKTYQIAYDSIPIYIRIKNNQKTVGQLQSVIHNNYYWNKAGSFSKFLNKKIKIGNILSWRYGPIIHDLNNYESILSEILKLVDEIAAQKNIFMIRGSSPPTISYSKKNFSKFSYTIKPWSTYIINLEQNLDEFYSKLNKKTRYDIRLAEKNNLIFEAVTDSKLFEKYFQLKNKGKKLDAKQTNVLQKFIKAHSQNMLKDGKEILFLAKHNDEIVSGISGIVFNKNLIQHTVGNSDKKDLQGGSFVTWNAIKWAKNNNLASFNMGGVNPEPESEKEKNIDFFKIKWSGKEYPYLTYNKIVKPTKYKLSKVLINPSKLLRKK